MKSCYEIDLALAALARSLGTPGQAPIHRRCFVRLLIFVTAVLTCLGAEQPILRAAIPELVLVNREAVSPASVAQWKAEGFKGVVLVLEEQRGKASYRDAAQAITHAGLELYYWIEVARNEEMARAHPKWMAALGMHQDWMKNFPKAAEPGLGEVAKAYPWVPIGYRETYEAHLKRIDQLLPLAQGDWRGLLLNDLQAGPSSCGCGNPQCRWAIDYQVRSTATRFDEDDVAARFVTAVRQRAGTKSVIPIWTIECESFDLPKDKHHGQAGTERCGTVGCATGACPLVFTRQWSALVAGTDAPIGLLALHNSLQRTQQEYGGGTAWPSNTVAYVNQTLPDNGGKPVRSDRFWLVVEGSSPSEEASALDSARQGGAGGVIVARTKIDQSYEPRIQRAD